MGASFKIFAAGGLMSAFLAVGVSLAARAEEATQGPRPVQLIAFDGVRELAFTSSRLGVLAQKLKFTLEVAPDGTVTGCKLSRKFRSPLVTKELCEILMRRAQLSPALDGEGSPVSGTYTGLIDFDLWIKPDR
jgi:hypothetical protein